MAGADKLHEGVFLVITFLAFLLHCIFRKGDCLKLQFALEALDSEDPFQSQVTFILSYLVAVAIRHGYI